MRTQSISKKAGRFSVLVLALLVAFMIMPAVSYGAQKAHEEMKLIMATYFPVGYPYMYKGVKIFPDSVNEKGKGIVQMESYWGGTLLRAKQLLPGLRAGTADIINQVGGYIMGTFPVLGIQSIPVWDSIASSYNKLKQGTPLYKIQNEVLKKKNIYQFATTGLSPEFLWTKKLVRTPADIKGLKIRTSSKIGAKVLVALGAVPVFLPSAELPQALQRGVVDGALMSAWTAKNRGVHESCKYVLMFSLSNLTCSYYVLWDKWNSWPEDVRKVLMDAGKEYGEKFMAPRAIFSDEQLTADLIPFYAKAGVTVVYPTKEEAETLKQMTKPVVDWWVKQVGEDVGKRMLKYTDFKY